MDAEPPEQGRRGRSTFPFGDRLNAICPARGRARRLGFNAIAIYPDLFGGHSEPQPFAVEAEDARCGMGFRKRTSDRSSFYRRKRNEISSWRPVRSGQIIVKPAAQDQGRVRAVFRAESSRYRLAGAWALFVFRRSCGLAARYRRHNDAVSPHKRRGRLIVPSQP